MTQGTKVWGEWKPGEYYPGRVREMRGRARKAALVAFDDGTSGWIPEDRLHFDLTLRAGEPVLVKSGAAHHRGSVVGERGAEVEIAFDAGQRSWVPRGSVRGFARYENWPQTGCRVLAPFDGGPYYPGIMDSMAGLNGHVRFDDGDQGDAVLESLLVLHQCDGTPETGTRVIAEFTDASYYRGVIKASGPDCLVLFDDGDEAMCYPHQIILDE